MIRPAEDADRAQIFDVHLRAVRETCARSYAPHQINAWTGVLSPETYSSLLRKRLMIVAADGGRVVGFGQLNREAREIEAIYVRPDRQGQGIGRRLLGELEQHARGFGLRSIEVSATLNAVGFYERNGYSRRRVAVHRMPTGLELQCVRMAKALRDANHHIE